MLRTHILLHREGNKLRKDRKPVTPCKGESISYWGTFHQAFLWGKQVQVEERKENRVWRSDRALLSSRIRGAIAEDDKSTELIRNIKHCALLSVSWFIHDTSLRIVFTHVLQVKICQIGGIIWKYIVQVTLMPFEPVCLSSWWKSRAVE